MPLYKYVTPERIDVLRTGRIRFSQPTALNDPFELRPYFDNLISDSVVLAYMAANPVDLTPQLTKAYAQLSDDQKRALPLDNYLATVKHVVESDEFRVQFPQYIAVMLEWIRDLAAPIRNQLADGIGSRVGILSLTEDPTNTLMWSHYAAQHQGMVYCFDEKHSFFDRRHSPEDTFYQVRPVVYLARNASQSLIDMNDDVFLFAKAPEWSYEREWRVLAPLAEADHVVENTPEKVSLFALPPGVVTGVILGARMSLDNRQAVQELLRTESRYRHLELFYATLDDSTAGVVVSSAVPEL